MQLTFPRTVFIALWNPHIWILILLICSPVESLKILKKVGGFLGKIVEKQGAIAGNVMEIRNNVFKKIPGINLAKNIGGKLMNMPVLKQIGGAVKPLVDLTLRLDPLKQAQQVGSSAKLIRQGRLKEGFSNMASLASDWAQVGLMAATGGTSAVLSGVAVNAAGNIVSDGVKKFKESKSKKLSVHSQVDYGENPVHPVQMYRNPPRHDRLTPQSDYSYSSYNQNQNQQRQMNMEPVRSEYTNQYGRQEDMNEFYQPAPQRQQSFDNEFNPQSHEINNI